MSERSHLLFYDDDLLSVKTSRRSVCTRTVVVAVVATFLITLLVCGGGFGIYYYYSTMPPSTPPCVNGVYYPDTGCQCFDCFNGSDCSVAVENCVINTYAGNPFVFEQFFRMQASTQNALETPLTYRLPYNYDLAKPLTENTTNGLSGLLNIAVRKLHKKYNNVVTDGYQIVFTHGATQALFASVYAICKAYNQTFYVYSPVPHYSDYSVMCTYMPHCCTFTSNLSLVENSPEKSIEIVTCPNNPDGILRSKSSSAAHWIHDGVYYWPHLTAEKITPKEAPITAISMSKFIGHAGTRLGWLVIKDPVIANFASAYVETYSYHVSVDAAYRSYSTINAMLTESGDNLISYVKSKLEHRWSLLNQHAAEIPFESAGTPNTWYYWIKCPNITTEEKCSQVLLSYGIGCFDGEWFGAPGYARIPLALHDNAFDLLLKYLTTKKINNDNYDDNYDNENN